MTDSRQSCLSETVGSDHIVRWNTAREISQTHPERPSDRPEIASAKMDDLGALGDIGRKWSWVPLDDSLQQPDHGQDMHHLVGRKDNHAAGDTTSDSVASSTVGRRLSKTRRLIEAKKEARRQRRNLKESGDYLGVQGANPETGQLDTITPTESDRSSTSQETLQKLNILRSTLRSSRHSYKTPGAQGEKAAKQDAPEGRKYKPRNLEGNTQKIKDAGKAVRWRRHTKQWSSAQEPDLSPIVQSRVSSIASPGKSRLDVRAADISPDVASADPWLGHIDTNHGADYKNTRLIDLASPARRTPLEAKERLVLAIDDTLAGNSSSGGTVVRTPHGQSLADLTPSAFELFANGISFNDSDCFEDKEPKAAPCLPAGIPCGCPETTAADEAALSSSRRPPQLQVGTPGKTTRRFESKPVAPTKESFLDRRVPPQTDVSDLLLRDQGLGETTAIMPVSQESLLLVPKRSLTLLRKKLNLGSLSPRTSSKLISLEPSEQQQDPDVTAWAAATRPSLQKLIHHSFGTFRLKMMEKKSRPLSSEDGMPILAPNPTSNLEHGQKLGGTKCVEVRKTAGVAGEGSHQTNARAMAVLPEAQPLTGRKGKNKQNTVRLLETQSSGSHDTDWCTAAMKKIADKSREVMDEFASTHTTTTTGCDHQTFSPAPEEGPLPEHRPTSRRQLSRLIYNLPPLSPTGHELRNIVQSPSQNTSQSSTVMGQREAVGTTSIKRSTSTKRRKDIVAAQLSAQPGREAQQIKAQCSISPKSTCIPQDGRSSEGSADTALTPTKEGREPSSRSDPQTSRDLTPRGAEDVARKQLMRAPRSRERTEHAGWMEGMSMPGAYPTHLDAEDDIDDPFESTTTSERATGPAAREGEGDRWASTKPTLRTAYHHLKALLALYWKIVWPVFQYRSEFWERNERREATTMDALALVLAMPTAVMGSVLLV